ncbi:hypothetical protein, partial [Leptotrichia sp. OH3620_COT-345]|uniref:hypothetical protein n=1 Tax=Leptotrichia sp. OH3620_COT-345 TaxID=2491048 RepID=UPI0013157AEB
GNLVLIAETLIRNNVGEIKSKGDIYGEVRNGRIENVGISEANIKEVIREVAVGVEETGYRGKRFGGIGRKNKRGKTEKITEKVLNIYTEDSAIMSEGNILIKAEKGDVVNKDGGRIEGKGISIKAINVYN